MHIFPIGYKGFGDIFRNDRSLQKPKIIRHQMIAGIRFPVGGGIFKGIRADYLNLWDFMGQGSLKYHLKTGYCFTFNII
jgi:hypothetical protein